MLAIMILFNLDNTYELLLDFEHNQTIINFILLGLFIGAMAKSAQIGLQSWLTSAMEAPTPISALIHAATMVTVGIYLLIRLNPLLAINDDFLLIILWLGSITALYGSTGALMEYDIKKIIAFSTISQLGYMASAIGLSYFSLAFTHLFNHALYKALLFLTSGIIIYITGYQDIRNLSRYSLWSIYLFILLGSFNLIAFPFTLGFFSKELILDLAFHKNLFIYFNLFFAAILTTLYSIRMCLYIFNKHSTKTIHKNSYSLQQLLLVSILILILFIAPNILDLTTLTIPMTIGFVPVQDYLLGRSMILIHSLISIILILIILGCFNIHHPKFNYSYIYAQDIVHNWFIWYYRKICNIIYRYIDRGIIEIMGPYGPIKIFQYISFMIDSNYYLRFFSIFTMIIFLMLI
jgi:NADH-ubiquinone oxidoreductase chain 5